MEPDTGTPDSVRHESIPTTPIKQTHTKTEVYEREIIIGNKYYVRLSDHMDTKGEIKYRIGEILANRTNYDRNQEYYIHFLDFNKRLDEWVSEDRIDIKRDVIVERPKLSTPKKTLTTNLSLDVSKVPTTPLTTTSAYDYSTPPPATITEYDSPGSITSITPSFINENSKGEAVGAMSCGQNKRRVKNLQEIHFGEYHIETWYFSPYPEEFNDSPIIYICEFCLSYFISEFQLRRHIKKCNIMHPPGNEIYRDEEISFFEIDGARQQTYCQNLCLLSKLFLDHKSLSYDLLPFLFYIMCKQDQYGYHIVGYFSKEKNYTLNNLACILTLPPYQRKGYGRLLISFSYELSKIEGRIGSPERPLSDLGLLSYQQYWYETILEVLWDTKEIGEDFITIDEITAKTSITQSDILFTLYESGICVYQGQVCIRLTEAMLDTSLNSLSRKRRINIENLKWSPPHFTANQLRYKN
ncbi:2978_t:CDS:1 [Funneliformis geosporum]|uniref:Histone acetyltransferase ESA1 n=1 Tax=Funneliformis geosporum TaxID=1117311 RepID=A0A9W4WT19_9GLOM|nr:18883_t:CDS:1 [Funneliformis geosporum]CAI2166245.1 2978_t:CDS:1 [Funneliformis geosporum]